jgi:hypothetical protein
MKARVAGQAVSERARPTAPPKRNPILLKNPVHITEDEADALISIRRLNESSVTLEEYLRRRSHELDS